MRVVCIGLLMGAAEIVPGVSGGTIAFISGIYERLVNALKCFTPVLILKLREKGIKAVWVSTDATFLALLFAAMGMSIVIFANAISYLLQNEPVVMWSFFFGLVLASCWVVSRGTDLGILETYLFLGLGVMTGLVITHLAPMEIQPSAVALFFGGMVAVCAWILPGISGSFILLILGLYAFVVEAIKSADLISLIALGAGCAVGLVSFAHLLSILFARFRNATLALLTGFMMGSLAKLWPWKNTVSYHLKSDGGQIPLEQEPVLPGTYEVLTQQSADVTIAGLAILSGVFLVITLDWFAKKNDV